MENKDKLVWYVCYGSNMHLKRMMCYLTGEAYPKYKLKEGKACINKNPPIDNWKVNIPYQLYFANKCESWENNGTAFINPKKGSGDTIARAYLITYEQFLHILKREGRNYQYVIKLDDIDRIEAYTFTSKDILIKNDPSKLYIDCVKTGLEELNLSSIEIANYVNKKIKPRLMG